MKSLFIFLKKITTHPLLQMFLAIVLIYAGLSEAWETASEDIRQWNLGAHHGIAILGIVNFFKSLPELFEGLAIVLGTEKE